MGCGVHSKASSAKVAPLEEPLAKAPAEIGETYEADIDTDRLEELQAPCTVPGGRRTGKNRQSVRKVLCQRRLSNLERPDDYDLIGRSYSSERPSSFTEDQKRLVTRVLQTHFLFAPLESAEHDMVVEQMVLLEREQGSTVVTKGEKGDECYIVLSGICSVCTDTCNSVAQLSAGSTFGELAMLYDVPRTATILCISPKVLLCMIRGPCFRRCLAHVKERCLNQTLGFLNNHSIFSKLILEEKRKLASALHPQTFEIGAPLIDENISSSAEWIFLLQEGKVEVTDQYKVRKVVGEGSTITCQRMLYGEKAVVAKALSRVKCLAIGQSVIDRLFGNIGEVLRRSTVRAFLESIAIFRELTEKQQMAVASLFKDEHAKKGEVIVAAPADPQLVVVMDGEVAVLDDSTKTWESEVPTTNSLVTATTVAPSTPCRFDSVICGTSPEPDIEMHHSVSLKVQSQGAGFHRGVSKLLRRGDVFGERNFSGCCPMDKSLGAWSDAVVCRVGHNEICSALQGSAKKPPPISWVIQRNGIKAHLQATFPFSALYDATLDNVVEAFKMVKHKPDSTIYKPGDGSSFRFFLVLEGAALVRKGETVDNLGCWGHFGVSRLALKEPVDAEVVASSEGCTVAFLEQERFRRLLGGAIFSELEAKMKFQNMKLVAKDIVKCDLLGQGKFGIVERVCIRGAFGEDFAMKRISKRLVLELEQQESIQLEREVLLECCHPLIVRFVGTFQDEHSLYFVMENLAGGDLFTAIRDIGVMNQEQTSFFGACIVLAIEYLHSRGIMYRDLKPENIMFKSNGFLKLIDLGCCSKKTRTYTFVGTPEYLAPEVILGKGYDKAVDWWSVGVIMYEMICGPLPFGESAVELDALQVMREVLEKPLSIPARVATEARDLLTGLLERSPEQRLGCTVSHGENEVREHDFFGLVQWEAILGQSAHPPYQPAGMDPEIDLPDRSDSAPLDGGFKPRLSRRSKFSSASMTSSRDDMGTRSQSFEVRLVESAGSGKHLAESELNFPPCPGANLSCFKGF